MQSADTDAVLSAAVSTLLKKVGASGAAVALAEGGLLVCRVSAGDIAPDVGATLSLNSGITGACVRTAKLLHCRDAQLDDRVDAGICRKLGIRSILVTPILVDGVVAGIVEALSPYPNAFQPVHVKWLEAVADWLRGACFSSNQQYRIPAVLRGPSEPQLGQISSNEVQLGRTQISPESAKPQITSNGNQDPGLSTFYEDLKQMAVTSTWEDIRRQLVMRLSL